MTNENAEPVVETELQIEQPTFRWLPWALAAGAAILYLITLNHWVTLTSLPAISRVTGWNWHPANLAFRPAILSPLYTLLTVPVRLLPMDWRPLAMNLLSAVLAVAVLWELARSVKLMPQDRTKDQRQRSQNDFGVLVGKICWIPAALAVGLLAFQLTFWQNATTATSEMLDLYLFAFCFRCLMEHRVTGDDRWLLAMSLAYGLGIANSWAMIAFSPCFLAGVIWMKGLGFFNIRFLVKTLVFGVAGLSLYLLVPMCDSLNGGGEGPFWQTLRVYLRYQKTYLIDLPFIQAPQFRAQLFVILLTSLFPLILCCIRWGRLGGDFNPAGSAVTNLMIRLMHVFFLALGASIFFDPPFSPSELSHKAMPFLTSYYMSALVAGYLAGYLVLIFGVEPRTTWQRSFGAAKVIDKSMVLLAMMLSVVLPVLLFCKNWAILKTENSDLLAKVVNRMIEALPASHTVILSDDQWQLMLLEAGYQRAGKTHQNLLLETSSLHYPRYHRYLEQHYPAYAQWLISSKRLPAPALDQLSVVDDLHVLAYVANLGRSNSVFYLHPSFGYFFEEFYSRPHGLVYELHRYPTNDFSIPPKLKAAEIEENQNFWFGQKDLIEQAEREAKTGSVDATAVAQVLSRALNLWGTELQKQNLLREAGERFTTATVLNPDNAVAAINSKFNSSLQKGIVQAVQASLEEDKNLRRLGNIDGVMLADGPFDELISDFRLGEILAQGRNRRQALQMFQRCLDLKPAWPEARLAIAKTYIDLHLPDRAVKSVAPLHSLALDRTNQVELLRVESYSLAELGRVKEGEKLLVDALARQRNDLNILGTLSYYYMMTQDVTNGLATLDQLLLLEPDNTWALFNKGKTLFMMGRYTNVIEIFNKFMDYKTKSFEPLLYRAIAYLQTGQLDKAKQDYENAEKAGSELYLFPVYWGLGEIAYRTKDTAGALRNYKRYLDLAPTNNAEYQSTKARYSQLSSGK